MLMDQEIVAETSRRAAYVAGARAVLPILVGVAPFGIIFGALAVSSGIPAWMVASMSAFVFAGSAQFVAIELIVSGTAIVIIALTTFLVNVRHNLYAATLAPHIGSLPTHWLAPLAFILTDESYVVVMNQFERPWKSSVKHWFYLGTALTMYIVWQISTWIGIWAGSGISDPASWGLDYALPATFIVMLIPLVRSRGILVCVFLAGSLSVLLHTLPYQSGLFISMLAGALAGVTVDRASYRRQSIRMESSGKSPEGDSGCDR